MSFKRGLCINEVKHFILSPQEALIRVDQGTLWTPKVKPLSLQTQNCSPLMTEGEIATQIFPQKTEPRGGL